MTSYTKTLGTIETCTYIQYLLGDAASVSSTVGKHISKHWCNLYTGVTTQIVRLSGKPEPCRQHDGGAGLVRNGGGERGSCTTPRARARRDQMVTVKENLPCQDQKLSKQDMSLNDVYYHDNYTFLYSVILIWLGAVFVFGICRRPAQPTQLSL